MVEDIRIKTGIEGLDEILEGGFIPASSILLEGAPGTGKTNLGLQILYNGIVKYNEPGILVSFEQRPEQIYRDALHFGMDLAPLREQGMFGVIQTSPVKLQGTLAGDDSVTSEEIDEVFSQINPKRLLLDSVSHFQRITSDKVKLRELLLQIVNRSGEHGVTTFLTKEIALADNAPISFEEYLVDSSLRLYNLPSGSIGNNIRVLEVRKTRGHGHHSGRHPMIFSSSGIEVFPHRKPQVVEIQKDIPTELPRVSTGVRGLDYLMHGGLVESSSTLLAGTAGTGKSTFALHFLKAGILAGEPGLLITLNESPNRMAMLLSNMGVDVDKAIEDNLLSIHYIAPIDACLDRLYIEIENKIATHGLKRLVIDSVSDFMPKIQEAKRIRDYLYSYVKLFEKNSVTAVMTSEMEQVTGSLGMADVNYAFVLDAVVYLGFVEIESQMRRVIMVLKQRGSDHETELRELILANDGPKIGAKFTGLSGVSGGVATGQYQVTVDELIQPITFIRSFADQLRNSDMPREKQQKLLDKMVQQADSMKDHLYKHFGLERKDD